MCLASTPKIPKPPAPPPPAPAPPTPVAQELTQNPRMKAAQRLAGRLGTGQLRIPLTTLNIP